ncbi:pyroglutamyl-peptidase I [Arthrobacter sp. MYb227]|uniref:pyroglutamyl-peptidase I family protein n=1 Tax=Arthrobacter sp. MYb227 TaxID=1848601 RepID=UPI0015E274C4|nr:pyroglutamyl-peptidase I [Arthrobacter sp. MYb227]
MILLTGFEPFGGETFNPSWTLAQRAAEILEAAGFTARAALLPCVFDTAPVTLNELLHHYSPDLVISLGLAAGRSSLSLEKIAINHIDARIADNAGEQPIDTPVVADGPNAYFSTLPLKRAMQEINARSTAVRAEVSLTAGSFVCNQVFYALMHFLEGQEGMCGGFIHIPSIEQDTVLLEEFAQTLADIARMGLETQTEPSISAGHLH